MSNVEQIGPISEEERNVPEPRETKIPDIDYDFFKNLLAEAVKNLKTVGQDSARKHKTGGKTLDTADLGRRVEAQKEVDKLKDILAEFKASESQMPEAFKYVNNWIKKILDLPNTKELIGKHILSESVLLDIQQEVIDAVDKFNELDSRQKELEKGLEADLLRVDLATRQLKEVNEKIEQENRKEVKSEHNLDLLSQQKENIEARLATAKAFVESPENIRETAETNRQIAQMELEKESLFSRQTEFLDLEKQLSALFRVRQALEERVAAAS